MITHQIRKGYDLRIVGVAERTLGDAPEPALVSLRPTDFLGIKSKSLVNEGDVVQTGDPLFFDRNRPDMQFRSPASGVVAKVALGSRRALLSIDIAVDKQERYAELPRIPLERLGSTPRAEVVAAVMASGLWPSIRQRPVGKIADPNVVPVAIFVNGMDTEPLAADPAFAVAQRGEDLQAGIDLLRALTTGPVYVTVAAGAPAPEFQALRGVELQAFAGPHPAGLVGTHIASIRPLAAGERIFYLKAQEAVLLGEWLRTGRYPSHRVVAVAGSAAPQRQYFRVRQGAQLDVLLGEAAQRSDLRVISGTVLSGTAEGRPPYLGYYAMTVTVIPEGDDDRDLLGWAMPQPKRMSFHRAVWPFPRDRVTVDARVNGGKRPIVNLGAWERVVPLDVLPTQLVRAIQAEDLEESLGLGLLEVTEEDVALCTVVDPCKIDVGAIVRKGLNLYEKES